MLYLGADHRGFELKAKIDKWLTGRGIVFRDLGAFEYDTDDDYVDYAIAVAQEVAKDNDLHRGIVICGTGVGVDIAANKVKGVRCGLGFEADQVHAARKDDDINILALSADDTVEGKALSIVEMFLTTEFVESERYVRRKEKIIRYEEKVD